MAQHDLFICSGTACQSCGSEGIRQALVKAASEAGVADSIRIVDTGCMGPCEQGPLVRVLPEDALYVHVTPDDAPDIISDHICEGQVVERLLWDRAVLDPDDLPFFSLQQKRVLSKCGRIDPGSMSDYIEDGGYAALRDVLLAMSPADVVSEIKASRLRGRGGAGFPTGRKWEFVMDNLLTPKYVVCNADEGDPGAFMDRAVLEGDPHAVIEGMAIAAYAVGAERGYVYVRAEYPLAIRRLEMAVQQAREAGYLGPQILGSSFSFDVETRIGAGAFVCGEETALMASIEGKRGEPRPRPPFPAQSGVWGQPTLINNVETLANVPGIIRHGSQWFGSVGTETSKGTKVFALAGQVCNTGLVEVPMGITLRELVFEVGGGVLSGRRFKAVQTGGPSGGCLPKDLLDLPIDYESLTSHGAIMGSGGVIVLDETSCMVDVARYFLDFTAQESCGKCAPCRLGIPAMLEILTRITRGDGTMEDLDRLQELARAVRSMSLCGLGQTAPNPVLSTLRYFEDEYRAHVDEGRCPAGVCGELASVYSVDPDACKSCDQCRKVCPTGAARGEPGQGPYTIDEALCIHCGACLDACPFDAVLVSSRSAATS